MKLLSSIFYPPLDKYSQYFIYALIDPRDGVIKYVGKSCNGFSRIRQHFYPSQLKNRTLKISWIKSLLSLGLHPTPIVLEEADSREKLSDLEKSHIARLKAEGIKLLNMTDGGEGESYHRVDNPVAWNKGFKTPSETKLAQSNARLGRKFKPRTNKEKAKIAEANIASHRKECKPFICLQNNKIYNSQREAAIDLDVNPSNVSGVLNGHKKTTKGYSFKYV